MEKTLFVTAILFLRIALNGFSQETKPADFFAGKWEILVTGSPRGDVRFKTNLIRKDGKLTGDLLNMDDEKDVKPITKIEETANKILIFFNSQQAGELGIELEKVDDNNLKGSVMGYMTTASRVKE